jgi:Raf kinase inhibitor-like YbhB/YbcL family protein
MRNRVDIFLAAAILGFISSGTCLGGDKPQLFVTSPAFTNSGVIPERFTCSGEDASPPLRWTGIPADAKTLVLIVDDPDAPSGVFTHWVVYNINPDSGGLTENALTVSNPSANYSQAVNDFGHNGYSGPCPPPGAPHHYHFKLYALSSALHLPDDSKVKQVEDAMQGHILATGEMIGTFAR